MEEALKGVRGSPVGLPLVDDAEVVSHFVYGTSTAAQWVNAYTGGTTMTAVSYSIDYTFGANHAFQYKSKRRARRRESAPSTSCPNPRDGRWPGRHRAERRAVRGGGLTFRPPR